MKEQKKGTKQVQFTRKMFVVLMVLYIIYKLGYALGAFLAYIGI